jgi:anti-sigma factor RsiW
MEAHLDGELDASQQALVREHFDQCPSCAAAFARLQRLREDLRSPSLYFRAPESLGRRVSSALRDVPRGSPQTQPLTRLWPWKWMAVAASIALVISLGTNLVLTKSYRTENQQMAREVVSGHVRAMLGTHLMDIASSDQHTVKPWFSGKLDFSPNVRDLAGQGFPLAGGRVDYLDARPVAALVFRRNRHVITLFTWPSGRSSFGEVSQNGYHVVAWTQDSMTYWAVSDLNREELQQFARLYRE